MHSLTSFKIDERRVTSVTMTIECAVLQLLYIHVQYVL